MANIAKLKELRAAVETFPDKRFDMNHFPTRVEKSACGCALYVGVESGLLPRTPRYRNYIYDYAEFYEITQNQMHTLFGSQDPTAGPTKGAAGKTEFLKRLDAFIGRK